MRKILLGFLIGIIVSMGTVYAAKVIQVTTVDYKVKVDGKEVTSEKINYNGKTYLELRKTAELLGAKVEWNGEKREANIYNKDYIAPGATPVPSPVLTPLPSMPLKEVKVTFNDSELSSTSGKFYACVKEGELMINHHILAAIPGFKVSEAVDDITVDYSTMKLDFTKNSVFYKVNAGDYKRLAVSTVQGMDKSWLIQASAIGRETGVKISLDGDLVKAIIK